MQARQLELLPTSALAMQVSSLQKCFGGQSHCLGCLSKACETLTHLCWCAEREGVLSGLFNLGRKVLLKKSRDEEEEKRQMLASIVKKFDKAFDVVCTHSESFCHPTWPAPYSAVPQLDLDRNCIRIFCSHSLIKSMQSTECLPRLCAIYDHIHKNPVLSYSEPPLAGFNA